MAQFTSKQNPHEARLGCLMEENITESDTVIEFWSSQCIHRKLAKYKKNSVSPSLNDFGVAVRGKQLVPDNHLHVCEGPEIEKDIAMHSFISF
jgi:hypothetical protein